MPDFFRLSIFKNSISDYLVFLLTLAAACVAIRLVGYFLLNRLGRWMERSRAKTGEFLVKSIKKYLIPVAYIVAFYLDIKNLFLSPALSYFVNMATYAAITILGAFFTSSVIVFLFNSHWEKKTRDPNSQFGLRVISAVIKIAIWGIALILFLENTGVKINSLIAGLGIGGIAVAFAAQAILSDIFCFFTIFLDRPFQIGDYIAAGDLSGTVEHIGIKTTRLRALSGEQLICSNSDLISSRLRNYESLQQRRVLFTLGVTYDTPHDKLAEIPGILKSIIEESPDTLFGRSHFTAYGEYSLNFETAYYIMSGDYAKYMDIHHRINLRIKEEFDRRGIKFALPSRTVFLPRPNPSPEDGEPHSHTV